MNLSFAVQVSIDDSIVRQNPWLDQPHWFVYSLANKTLRPFFMYLEFNSSHCPNFREMEPKPLNFPRISLHFGEIGLHLLIKPQTFSRFSRNFAFFSKISPEFGGFPLNFPSFLRFFPKFPLNFAFSLLIRYSINKVYTL